MNCVVWQIATDRIASPTSTRRLRSGNDTSRRFKSVNRAETPGGHRTAQGAIYTSPALRSRGPSRPAACAASASPARPAARPARSRSSLGRELEAGHGRGRDAQAQTTSSDTSSDQVGSWPTNSRGGAGSTDLASTQPGRRRRSSRVLDRNASPRPRSELDCRSRPHRVDSDSSGTISARHDGPPCAPP